MDSDSVIDYFFPDRPRCARDGALLYYASLNETVDLSCLVDAYPTKGLAFKWTLVQKVGAAMIGYCRIDTLSR